LSSDFERARRQIADCELDLLLYTDLGMDHFTYFLAFARLAPTQCVLAGHPITSGVPTIDHFISNDAMEPADAADHYRERLIRLRGLMTRLGPPPQPPRSRDRESFGFHPREHLYFCPQTLFKLHPDFDLLIGEILRRDPRGVLVLFHAESPDWSELLRQRMQRTIPDVVARIAWRHRLPMNEFLALTEHADVMLDTPHFNGGTTSMLAMALGTPIVTLPGPYMRGRTTYVCYQQTGITNLIARDPADYIQIATNIGTNRDGREALRSQLRAASECLFTGESVVREFENCLRDLHTNHEVGAPVD
jgi:predicted O-linked N-acetylglucosamine transferase (SPINDLY family)